MKVISSSKECPQCGSNHRGKPFCVYENGFFCFSCGYCKKGDRSFAVRELQIVNTIQLPNCISSLYNFSITNQLWLNKYFITAKLVNKYNILEHQDGSLVFPTIVDGEIVHYQRRYNVEPRIIISNGSKIPAVSSIGSDTIVLVEDYISYVRISEYVDCMCLFGTKVRVEFLKPLFNKYSNILVWLDNDTYKQTNSGQESAKIICKTLNDLLLSKYRRCTFGNIKDITVRNIITDKDPKCFSNEEIKTILGGIYESNKK